MTRLPTVRALREAMTVPCPRQKSPCGWCPVCVAAGDARDALCNLVSDLADDLLDAREEMARQEGELARLRAIVEGRSDPPTREQVAAHAEAHGGYWLVSRVNNGRIGADGERAQDWRPLVLRVVDACLGPTASIPGTCYGGAWSDDPWQLMEGATWTPLDRGGRLLPAPDAATAARREG